MPENGTSDRGKALPYHGPPGPCGTAKPKPHENEECYQNPLEDSNPELRSTGTHPILFVSYKAQQATMTNSIPTKRSYNRRTDEQIISDYEAQIEALKARKEAKERGSDPVAKEFSKFKKKVVSFAQTCMDNDRSDISNSAMAFISMLERQVKSS